MPSNLGVSNEPGRLVEEAGVPDLEPPPRPLEGGNLPPFLGVYIRSETFLVLISATSSPPGHDDILPILFYLSLLEHDMVCTGNSGARVHWHEAYWRPWIDSDL